MALTNKRRIFVEEYLRCWNASEAARRAEYAHPGSQGHELLKKPEIQAYIKTRLEQVCMSADEVLSRLTELARDNTRTDVIRALELIGKHHRLFVDVQETKLEHNVSDDVLATISDALGRAYGHGDPDSEAD